MGGHSDSGGMSTTAAWCTGGTESTWAGPCRTGLGAGAAAEASVSSSVQLSPNSPHSAQFIHCLCVVRYSANLLKLSDENAITPAENCLELHRRGECRRDVPTATVAEQRHSKFA